MPIIKSENDTIESAENVHAEVLLYNAHTLTSPPANDKIYIKINTGFLTLK